MEELETNTPVEDGSIRLVKDVVVKGCREVFPARGNSKGTEFCLK
jgi:hypothetical protein